MDTFRLSEPIFMFGATELPYMAVLWTQILRPTKLPYMAVLWTLFGCLSQNPYKTADLSSSMDTFRLLVKSVHRTAIYGSSAARRQNCGPWQFYGHFSVVSQKCP